LRDAQLWDFGSGSLIERVAWNQSAMVSEPCFVCVTRVRRLASVMAFRGRYTARAHVLRLRCGSYSAQFSTDARLIAAGGSGANEAKVWGAVMRPRVRG
jgi:hypothetical protein